jgi:hypothetical protein
MSSTLFHLGCHHPPSCVGPYILCNIFNKAIYVPEIIVDGMLGGIVEGKDRACYRGILIHCNFRMELA